MRPIERAIWALYTIGSAMITVATFLGHGLDAALGLAGLFVVASAGGLLVKASL